jgi:hypothetical protein
MNKIPLYEGLTNNNSIPNVFDEIVDLDLRYAKYIQCNNPDMNPNNILKCSDNDKNIDTINAAYSKLMGDTINYNDWLLRNNKRASPESLNEYRIYISQNGHLIQALNTNKISKSDYEKNLHNILNKHREVLKLRNELDVKTEELYKINNPYYRDHQAKLDASIYSGILWSILASSLLYYVFIKL